jgi:tetratricopeptide (TPR) repeat protein
MQPTEQALQALREALRVSPDNAPLRLHLADTLLDLKRPAEAEVEYRALLQADPQNVTVKLRVGHFLGNLWTSRSDFRRRVVDGQWRRLSGGRLEGWTRRSDWRRGRIRICRFSFGIIGHLHIGKRNERRGWGRKFGGHKLGHTVIPVRERLQTDPRGCGVWRNRGRRSGWRVLRIRLLTWQPIDWRGDSGRGD